MKPDPRRCSGCGEPLSRYNPGHHCGVCQVAQRTQVPTVLVSPHVWFLPVMRAALASWDWQTVLTMVVAESGARQAQLAAVTGVSQPTISRLINGLANCYDIRTINQLVDGLGVPRAFAGLNPAAGAGEATVEDVPTKGVAATLRRTLLATSLASPLMMVFGGSDQVTLDRAQQIRGLLPQLYALDDQVGGNAVSEVTQWCLRQVDDLLGRDDAGEAAGRELRIAYGELAEMAGWLEFDAARYQQAQYHYGEALRAAQLGDDLSLEVLVLASMIMLARHRGRPREAVQVAQLAQRRATGWASPRLTSLLAAREAVGWAQLGDATGARNALHRAYHCFSPAAAAEDPAWIAFYDTAQLTGIRALVSSHLGQPDQAAIQYRSALEAVEPQYPRNRGLYATRLTMTYLSIGADSDACSTLDESLDLFTTVKSGRALGQFHECLAGVSRMTSPKARHLIERARSLNLVGGASG